MTKQSSKSLKALNVPALSAVVLADILLTLYLVAPNAIGDWKSLIGGRLLIGGVFPVVCVLLSSLLPASTKAVLVYWRRRDVLPGCRAFSHHGPSDPRIDMDSLVKKVGVLPVEPAAQNALWYKLYKAVDAEAAVQDAHKNFLLFRDLAAMSAVELGACALLLFWFPWRPVLLVAALLVTQYLLAALASRFSGIRLVTSVLAQHGAEIAKVKKPAKPRKVE